jgi:hypothetical protein
MPLKTVFQLAVIAATAAGPLAGSAAAVALTAGFGLAGFADGLPPPPHAARISPVVTADATAPVLVPEPQDEARGGDARASIDPASTVLPRR